MFDDYEIEFQNLETEMSGKIKFTYPTLYELLLAQYHIKQKALDDMKRFFGVDVSDYGPDPNTIEALNKAIIDLELEEQLSWKNKKKECETQQDGAIHQPIDFQGEQGAKQKRVIESKKEIKFRHKDVKRKRSLQTDNAVDLIGQSMKMSIQNPMPKQQMVARNQFESQQVFDSPQGLKEIENNPQITSQRQQQVNPTHEIHDAPRVNQQVSQGSELIPDEQPQLKGQWMKKPTKYKKPHVSLNQPPLPQIRNPTIDDDERGSTDSSVE